MSAADNLLRRLDLLEAALAARKAGLPSSIVVPVYSNKPDDIEAAKMQAIGRYGIESMDVIEAAGVKLIVTKLPWAKGRGVGITSLNDPRISIEVQSAQDEETSNRSEPIIGTKQQIEGFE